MLLIAAKLVFADVDAGNANKVIVCRTFCSILTKQFAAGVDRSDEAISIAGPRQMVLHERGLSKIDAHLLELGGFCINDILWT